MPKVRWVLSYGFQISYAFLQCKNFENLLILDKVTESLKVGTFPETQCDMKILCICVAQLVDTDTYYSLHKYGVCDYLAKISNHA